MRLVFFKEDPGLDAGLAIFLTEFLEGEGSLANASLGGFVLEFVDVGQDGGELIFDLSSELLHNFGF